MALKIIIGLLIAFVLGGVLGLVLLGDFIYQHLGDVLLLVFAYAGRRQIKAGVEYLTGAGA